MQRLQNQYKTVIVVHADINTTVGLASLYKVVQEQVPALNMIINNAGIQLAYDFFQEHNAVAKIDEEIGINLTAHLKIIHQFLPLLRRQPNAAIINIISCLALTPKRSAPVSVYCATKAALRRFTLALRYQLENSDVKIIEVLLPLVATRMTEGRNIKTISPDDFVDDMMVQLKKGRLEIWVGKSRLLAIIYRVWPSLAAHILKNG